MRGAFVRTIDTLQKPRRVELRSPGVRVRGLPAGKHAVSISEENTGIVTHHARDKAIALARLLATALRPRAMAMTRCESIVARCLGRRRGGGLVWAKSLTYRGVWSA